MSGSETKRSPLALIAVVAIVAVADAALYKRVFALLGTAGGVAVMVIGSAFVIWAIWLQERRG